MKKVLVLAVLAVACSFTVAKAQGGGGDPAARAAQMKERLKTTLGLTDVQADSVMAIQNDLRPKQMALRSASEADRPAMMAEINSIRNKRLEAALPKDVAKKVEDMYAQQRPGGGRPPGGGGGN